MKLFISLLCVFAMNFAHAEVATLDSYFSPSLEKDDPKIIHLWMQNNCNQEVYVATKSMSPKYVWETKGYMRIYPGQLIRVGDLINNSYLLNATTADGRISWDGPYYFQLNDTYVRAAMVELPRDYGGNWTTVLYCF